MINKFWTYLNRGVTNEFGRKVTVGAYLANPAMAELHAKLVPKAELSYSCLCTEQLLQIVLSSSLASTLKSSDVLNTYGRGIDMSPNPFNSISSSYSGIEVFILDESTDGWIQGTFTVILNPTLMVARISSSLASVSTVEFTIADNMSSKIPLSKGFYLRFRGTLPSEPVTISVSSVRKFRRNPASILSGLELIRIPWINQEYAGIYRDSKIPLEKVAAATMNLYEGLNNG